MSVRSRPGRDGSLGDAPQAPGVPQHGAGEQVFEPPQTSVVVDEQHVAMEPAGEPDHAEPQPLHPAQDRSDPGAGSGRQEIVELAGDLAAAPQQVVGRGLERVELGALDVELVKEINLTCNFVFYRS